MKNEQKIFSTYKRVITLSLTFLLFCSFQNPESNGLNIKDILTLVTLFIAIFTSVFIGFKRFVGLERDIKKYLSGAEVKAIIKEKVAIEVQKIKDAENAIFKVRFFVISQTNDETRKIDSFLKSQNFENAVCTTQTLEEKPITGEIIVFHNLATTELERIASENGTAYFIYYNTKKERYDGEIDMKSYANVPSTLKDRILQALKTNV